MKKICKGPTCGAEIEFLENAQTGRKVVVNAKPLRGWAEMPGQPGRVFSGRFFIDHHASCPDVQQFRKTKEAPSAG